MLSIQLMLLGLSAMVVSPNAIGAIGDLFECLDKDGKSHLISSAPEPSWSHCENISERWRKKAEEDEMRAKTPRVSDWNVIAADPSKFVLSIDLQSITPVGLPAEGKRQAWFKSVFMADWPIINTPLGAKQAAQRMELIYVDC